MGNFLHMMELQLKKKLQHIGRFAVNNSKVETITFEDGALADASGISEGAFLLAESLTKIVLPNTLAFISDGMFYSCSLLASIIIPKSADVNDTVDNQESYFGNCTSLTHVYIESTTYSSTQIANLQYGKPSSTNFYFYSENSNTDGTHWHYDSVTGEPVIWTV
ncbi:MAG: leucine-rich repeat protein [Erysipelotrichaceae bacterium]|nr:leucine-rich repeat protein [Erysipelotrichaceae bacterium]